MVLPKSTHPIRMCLGCRQRSPVIELVRVTVHDDPERRQPALIVDHRKNLPGRGAWLHPDEDCVSSAVRRKAFGPALRTPGLTVRPEDLAEITAGSASKTPPGVGEGE